MEAWQRKELSAQLREMPDEFIRCRDIRHSWAVVESYREVTDPALGKNVFSRILMCESCGAVRRDIYRHTRQEGMVKINAYYRTPPGYAFKNLSDVPGKSNHARAEGFRRERNNGA